MITPSSSDHQDALLSLKHIEAPENESALIALSLGYQREWRFEKERLMLIKALENPDLRNLSYIQTRLEWLSRPTFHLDPEKSRVQPRALLDIPRDPQFIPQQSTIDHLCFVTATNHNSPHFELAVQMMESIKATKHYNHNTIGVIDLGMRDDQKQYLIDRFGARIAIFSQIFDLSSINPGDANNVGRVAEKARSLMSRAFPGFQYYYWFDCDTWIQDENAVDKMVYYTEKQGMCASIVFLGGYWRHGHFRNPLYGRDVSKEDFDRYFMGKRIFHDDMFCIRHDLAEYMANYDVNGLAKINLFHSSVFLHHTFYKYTSPPHYVIDDPAHHFGAMFRSGAWTNEKGDILTNQNRHVGIISLMGPMKNNPFYLLFPGQVGQSTTTCITMSKQLATMESGIAEELAHLYRHRYGWKLGSYQFRTFPRP